LAKRVNTEQSIIHDSSRIKCHLQKAKAPFLLSELFVELKANFQSEEEFMPDNVTYKQWITTDRAEMKTIIQPKDKFFESLRWKH
jgi:hemerythrin